MFTKNSNFARCCRAKARRGWSMIEMMVGLGLGTAVVGSVLPTGVTVTNSMVAIENYCDLNRASCNTLDNMSRDLRNTAKVTSICDNRVTVSNVLTADVVTYAWDGSNNVVRIFNGVGKVVLSQCDYLKFSSFQRNPTNNFQFLPASSPETTKLISVSWRCSRQILGAKINTESVQTAQICIRN
jgi:hypothetical protein